MRYLGRFGCDSPVSPRAAAIAELSARMAALVAAGDIEAARVLNEAIGRLLGGGEQGEGSPVVDLGAERAKRDGRGVTTLAYARARPC